MKCSHSDKIFKMTITSAASDENFIKMTFSYQCISVHLNSYYGWVQIVFTLQGNFTGTEAQFQWNYPENT